MMTCLPQEEICPISEQLLFSLYDAAKRGLPVPVGAKNARLVSSATGKYLQAIELVS